MHSLRRSLRESFRQRRTSTSAINDRKKIAESLNLETTDISHKKQSARSTRPIRASSEPTSPVAGAAAGNELPVSVEYHIDIVYMHVMHFSM